MFAGHYAVALISKKIDSRPSLGTYALASQWIDLVWPVLLIAGVEHVRIAPGITRTTPLDFYDYPYSHSLAAVVCWALLFLGGYFLFTKRFKTSLLLGFGVISHWLLDWLTHRPDLPLTVGGQERVGLGLWNHPAASFAIEIGAFVICAVLYLRSTVARDKVGKYATYSLLGLVLLIGASSYAGTPPPSVNFLQWQALSQWLLIAWAYWADAHRTPKTMVRAAAR